MNMIEFIAGAVLGAGGIVAKDFLTPWFRLTVLFIYSLNSKFATMSPAKPSHTHTHIFALSANVLCYSDTIPSDIPCIKKRSLESSSSLFL
jgi:hypothetical protein